MWAQDYDYKEPIDPAIFSLPTSELNRYADACPKNIRSYYYKKSGVVPQRQVPPSLDEYGLTNQYEADNEKEEQRISKKANAILLCLYIIGYIICVYIYWNHVSSSSSGFWGSIWGALLGPVFTYGWGAPVFFELFLSNIFEGIIYKKKQNTPLKQKIASYEEDSLNYSFWENVAFFYSAEKESLSKCSSEYTSKMNFLDAHSIVHEYFDLFAQGKAETFGFPASDLSFYGVNWKDLLFDAAKIWVAHAVIYDERTDDQIDRVGSLLISYNLGVDRVEYESLKTQYNLFISTNGKQGRIPDNNRFFKYEKYNDYTEFLKWIRDLKQELSASGFNAKSLPYQVVRKICLDVYQRTEIRFVSEYVPYYLSFSDMRFDLITNSNSIYKPYRNYISNYQ